MQKSIKGVTGGKGRVGLTRYLGAFYRRMPRIVFQGALPYELLAHELPYEASKTYRMIKTEFERTRAEALVIVSRQALRGF